MAKRREHPSGRPVLEDERVKTLTVPRVPREDFLNPRMQHRDLVDAIGFHHVREVDDDDEDGEE